MTRCYRFRIRRLRRRLKVRLLFVLAWLLTSLKLKNLFGLMFRASYLFNCKFRISGIWFRTTGLRVRLLRIRVIVRVRRLLVIRIRIGWSLRRWIRVLIFMKRLSLVLSFGVRVVARMLRYPLIRTVVSKSLKVARMRVRRRFGPMFRIVLTFGRKDVVINRRLRLGNIVNVRLIGW